MERPRSVLHRHLWSVKEVHHVCSVLGFWVRPTVTGVRLTPWFDPTVLACVLSADRPHLGARSSLSNEVQYWQRALCRDVSLVLGAVLSVSIYTRVDGPSGWNNVDLPVAVLPADVKYIWPRTVVSNDTRSFSSSAHGEIVE